MLGEKTTSEHNMTILAGPYISRVLTMSLESIREPWVTPNWATPKSCYLFKKIKNLKKTKNTPSKKWTQQF